MKPVNCPLAKGEFQIAMLLIEGLSHDEIAERRGTTTKTVRSLLSNAYKKLGVKNQAGLVARMHSEGWVWAETNTDVEGVSPAQRLYLNAFDRYLKDESQERLEECRFWLRGIFYERDMEPWEVLGGVR